MLNYRIINTTLPNRWGLFFWCTGMAKYTEKQITIARTAYEAGDSLLSASKQANIPEATLRRYAKSESWEQGKWRTEIEENANSLKNIVKNDEAMTNEMTNLQKQMTLDRIINLSGLKTKAQSVQESMLELVELSTKQVKQILQDNPSGLHVKSQNENGETFGRNTEFVKDLIPAMTAANAILGVGKDDKPTTAIQINNENKTEEKVIINIEGI